MVDSLHINLAGHEEGSISINDLGQMVNVYEREAEGGDFILARRVLTPESAWSPALTMGKDGKWAKNPGQEWGQEVALGEGDVGMENYLRTLQEIGYTGPLTIEREISHEPERQKSEIGKAIKLLTELKVKIG